MGRYLASGKEYVRHHLPQQALVSIMLFAAAPLLAGVRNLSVGETARLLDFYVVLPGMLLLIPVFLPEQDKAIRDLIRARYTSMGSIYLVRIFLNVAVMAALTGVFLLGLERGGCDFPFGNYFMASLAGMVFLGGFGAAAFALSDNPVIGYMASLGYYLFSFGAGAKYLGNWYLFSLVSGSYKEKVYLADTGVALLAAAIVIRVQKTR